mgnify:CR=1 FL=1
MDKITLGEGDLKSAACDIKVAIGYRGREVDFNVIRNRSRLKRHAVDFHATVGLFDHYKIEQAAGQRSVRCLLRFVSAVGR